METPPPLVEVSSTSVPPITAPYAEQGPRGHGDRGGYSPFLPLLILTLAGVAWSAFQCYQLVSEKTALTTVFGNQSRQVEEAGKLRGAIDNLARETAALAAKGNPSAKLIVDELARRGITINPTAPSVTTPGAQPAAPAPKTP
jgi:hypothetical protein